MNGEKWDLALLEATLSARPYLVQEWLVPRQHRLMARYNPSVINSIRLVTFDTMPGPSVVTGFFRSGIDSRSVDNWNSGGVAVSVDLERSVLAGCGILKKKDILLPEHPLSGICFDGEPVPYLAEATALVQRLHSKLRSSTLGWDLALLEDGPLVMECNGTGWDIAIPAILQPEFTAKFLAFHLPRQERSLRLEFSGNFRQRDDVWQSLCKVAGLSRVSARLDTYSHEGFIVTVAGSPATLDAFFGRIKGPYFRAGFTTMRGRRVTERIRPGLDLSASFSPQDEIRGAAKLRAGATMCRTCSADG